MLMPAIEVDASMRASGVLERMALHGFWLDAGSEPVQRRASAIAGRLGIPAPDAASRLARDPRGHGVAVRRQLGFHLYWYAFALEEVLFRCTHAAGDLELVTVLDLHETDAVPAHELADAARAPLGNCVLLEAGAGVAVAVEPPRAAMVASGTSAPPRMTAPAVPGAASVWRGGVDALAAPAPAAPLRVWPRVNAPAVVHAGDRFEVEVGFSGERLAGVFGNAFVLPFDEAHEVLDVTIELGAEGVAAPEGWTRTLRVSRSDPGVSVRFPLVAGQPAGGDGVLLTMLEVRYVVGATVCGTATRPLAVLAPGGEAMQALLTRRDNGVDWRTIPPSASPVTFAPDPCPPDLTLEITKPGRNAADGRYTCVLRSPHALGLDTGPFDIDLGQDARTFARAMVDEIRLFSGNDLIDEVLRAHGQLVASRLPHAFFEAVRRVAAKVAPAACSLLIVSAEPYVPWELAWMETPLDASRPAFLGAQVLAGRWLREDRAASGDDDAAAVQKPPPHPLSSMPVDQLAVMAAHYKASTGLVRLLKAELEARTLAEQFPSVPLPATSASLKQLLNAALVKGFDPVRADAVHFAGHGDYDPTRVDGSVMYLEDGLPLRSSLFRAAKYGGPCQPLLFLNACMLGIGGELLGDMGGFPGNSLRGGFGAVLGALWEVDDQVAHDVALEFWRRALPPAPARGEPVGAILRDLRSRYAAVHPVATYLAYVYYGHPLLTLQRMH